MKPHFLPLLLLTGSALVGPIVSHASAEPGDPLPKALRTPGPAPLVPHLPCQIVAATPVIYASKASANPLHMRTECTLERGEDGLWRAKSCRYSPKWDGFYMPKYLKAEHYRQVVAHYMEHACFTDGQLTPFLTDEQNDQPDSVSEEDAWSYRTITPWSAHQVATGISPAQDEKIGKIYQNSRVVTLKVTFTHLPPVTAEENDIDQAAHSPNRFGKAVSVINLDDVSAAHYPSKGAYKGQGGFFSPVVSMVKDW